ncbi:MAG: extracellular solute-binding protein [Tenuifilaceae bacterium]|nr:extracellular solute-binding protein [Sphaerochaeta sp.]MDX9914547.1 extracellular solute-binding protein [Sphaerochaeta sp.]MDY0255525.1 extracellular solute-binding protein [Tenuifilaceae bacterium]
MTKKRMFMLALVALILLPGLLFAMPAAEEKAESTMRLAWWGNPTRDERTLKAADMFMAKYPGVKIESETTGWAGYWDKLATQAVAGSLPDLIQHDYAYMLQWVVDNQLADLTPYVKDGTIDLSKVNESFLTGGMVDGKIYGISLGTNAVCLTYDPAVLARAGIAKPNTATWTWEDFERIALEVYRKTGVQTLPFFTTDPRVGFEHLIRQTGAKLFGTTGLGFTDVAALREFYAIQLRLLDAGALVRPEVAFVSVSPEEGEFAKGKSWVEFIWSNQFVATQAAAGRPLELGLMPILKGAKAKGTYLKPSMFFSIPASAENPKDAARFLNYFLNDIEVNDMLMGERGIPIPDDVRAHMATKVDAINKQIFDFISLASTNSGSIDPPDPPAAGEFLKMARDVTLEILLKRISLDAGVAKIMNEGNNILR